MKRYYTLISILVCLPMLTYSQLTTVKEGYKVEKPKFSPPVEDMANSFMEKPAPGFQANDLNQISRTISNYYGKSLVIFFWGSESEICKEYIPYINELNRECDGLKSELLSFGDESRSQIQAFSKDQNIEFTVVPNGAFLGEAIYGEELGTPRFFIADRKGIIRAVIPEEAASVPVKTIAHIKMLLTDLKSNN